MMNKNKICFLFAMLVFCCNCYGIHRKDGYLSNERYKTRIERMEKALLSNPNVKDANVYEAAEMPLPFLTECFSIEITLINGSVYIFEMIPETLEFYSRESCIRAINETYFITIEYFYFIQLGGYYGLVLKDIGAFLNKDLSNVFQVIDCFEELESKTDALLYRPAYFNGEKVNFENKNKQSFFNGKRKICFYKGYY